MKKNYVLDTNVLLHDPQAIFRFEDNRVFVPIYCIEEVDQFKHEGSTLGRNARQIARLLDELRAKGGSLAKGISLDSGGYLQVAVPEKRPSLDTAIDKGAMDQAILQTAFDVCVQHPSFPTVFVTMDANLRIRADALGMTAENYETVRVASEELNVGIKEIETTTQTFELFSKQGFVALPDLEITGEELSANLCILLRDRINPSHAALGRYRKGRGEIAALDLPSEGVMGVRSRNKEQSFALDLLLDDSIRLVTLVGKAGTGKTLLALAAGLKRTVEDGAYSRLLVSRPVMPLGRDIGFLPGDVDEKLNPWMQPIFDNLEFLFSGGKRKGLRPYTELLENGYIQVEPLTYIRGRSLPQQFIIVDEAQNLTPHEIKTIITRSGDGTKIVLTGDPGQIDNPYVDSASNGLCVAANRFRGEQLAGHIGLVKGERSELAELASNLL